MTVTTRRLFGVLLALLVVVLGVLAGLGGAGGAAVAKPPSQLQVSTQPPLFPTFNESVSDYVVRCQPSNEVQVSVSAPGKTKVSVDDGQQRAGAFTQTVSLGAGQSFDITVTAPKTTTKTYFIRCLPSDFPAFTSTRNAPTQAEWYAVTPTIGFPPPGVSQHYLAFFDNNGVPVWWMRSAIPGDAKLLPNGNVAWLQGGPSPSAGEERRLDGSLVRTLDTVPGRADFHDIQLLPNGNYLLGRYFVRSGVDMSSCGGSTSRDLVDFELQELSPNGGLVWSWRASDHIPYSEVTTRWESRCTTNGDIYHWNSVEADGDGYVLSFRHLDAVYRIDRATGAIDWKLGGETRPESLTVVGDPLSSVTTFCGQHDARVLGDGSLTVHDNGSGCNRPPRAVRFAIDDTAHTATLVEDLRDPEAPSSGCCGSTRRLPGGNWVTQWGANPYLTEQTGTGDRVFKLSFASGLSSYRANPVLPGQLDRAALRAGMNAQYPRPTPSGSYATTVLGTSGLVSYWRLNEASGVTAVDSKGSNDGTYNGDFTLGQPGAIAGEPDTSLSLDGSSGYLSTPVNPAGTQGTIEFWGYATDLGVRNGFVYTADDGTSTYSHQIGVGSNGSVRLYLYDGSLRIADTASGLITANTWHYYALVWSDGGTADLYVDGTKRASVAIGSSWKGGDKLLFGHAGGGWSGITNPWQGRIDEAAVYNLALSATTIQQHYNSA